MNPVMRGNLVGVAALLMWCTMIGLIRSITDAFGVAAGTALIYSSGALVLFLKNGIPQVRQMPRPYLFGVGSIFILYEVAFSQAIGLATSSRQTLEVGMLNYLWPCFTILFSMWINKTRLRWLVWPGTALAVAGLYWCVASNGNLDLAGLVANVQLSPLPYFFGLVAAITWALYCNLSVRTAKGHNGVSLFFSGVAVVLWISFFLQGGELHYPGLWPLGQLGLIGLIVGFSYSFWETGIHQGNFIFLALCSYFSPANSMLFTAFLLNVMPPSGFWVGVGMVVGGSLLCWLATMRKKQQIRHAAIDSGRE